VWVGLASRAFPLALLVSFGVADPAHAQIEPESFTILKEALCSNPPNPAAAARMLLRSRGPADQENLEVTWLTRLAAKAPGKGQVKRRKIEEALDAFDGCFGAGDGAKRRARTFIKLRDELLARSTSEKEIERSASAFVDRLRLLPAAERRALKEFGKSAKRRIRKVVK
jgi:hypothetical protein